MAEFLRGYPADDRESVAAWVRRTGQTERAVRHFWEPVVVATLNDVLERCSVRYAGKVFHETLLRSAEGGRLGIPAVPLSEFLQPVVERAPEGWRVGGLTAANVVLAVNFKEAAALAPLLGIDAGAFTASPITTVQLWLDRDVTGLDHAALLDTRIQWMFSKSRIRRWEASRGSYLELTISASWAELKLSREAILAETLRELALFFPAVREARLLKSGVLKEARATFSVTPGLDRLRPAQRTGLPGLFLAGDWTATGWPSTMEGAVRGGRLAAGEVVGDRGRFLAAELRAGGLMRWLSRMA
jgi:zeta-carotene desaturase